MICVGRVLGQYAVALGDHWRTSDTLASYVQMLRLLESERAERVFNSTDGTFYAASHRTAVWMKLMRIHVSLLATVRS